jgi:nucleoside-diphosphate kinase
MAVERTLSIVKPDAVGRKLTGEILARIEKAGFRIVALKSLRPRAPEPRVFTPCIAAKASSPTLLNS